MILYAIVLVGEEWPDGKGTHFAGELLRDTLYAARHEAEWRLRQHRAAYPGQDFALAAVELFPAGADA